jgi:hypothetical protein
MQTPQNDVMGNKILFKLSKALHWKLADILNSYVAHGIYQ